MPKQPLRIATRNSPLALWQANYIGNLIKQHSPETSFELLPLVTSGDRFLNDALQNVGGKGLFVKEIEEALLDNRADLAVHSMKDLPAQLPEELNLAAICSRDLPFDVLLSCHYDNLLALPAKSIVGTTSLRRQSQLLAFRPDLIVKPLRGNINTRIKKLEEAAYDAIILAAAGLLRLGHQTHVKEVIDDQIMLPACGQGALGIECRIKDKKMQRLLSLLNDPFSAVCVTTERQVNALLGGHCHAPLAVYCSVEQHTELLLRAKVLSPDGIRVIKDEQRGFIATADDLARKCVENLVKKGADDLLKI